ADEMFKLSETEYRAVRAEVFASKTPSDPGLKVTFAEATLTMNQVPKRSIFGRRYVSRETGLPEFETKRILTGTGVLFDGDDLPDFRGNATDPLGPLDSFGIRYDRIFGTQVLTTFDVYELLGIDPFRGTNWILHADYLSERGPGLGSDFDYNVRDLFGLPGRSVGRARSYLINDQGEDMLGGGRGPLDHHPDWRGRYFWTHYQELPYDLLLQAQVSYLSDKNFLEQYYKNEFDLDPNQETFLYLTRAVDIYAGGVLVKPHIRDWVTATAWVPYAEGRVIGFSTFALLTYNLRARAGYARSRPTELPPPPLLPTEVLINAGRFDLRQELAAPFALGPLKLVPYGVVDLTQYTDDLTG